MTGKLTAFAVASVLTGCTTGDAGDETVAANASQYVTSESTTVTFVDWTAVRSALDAEDLSNDSDPEQVDEFYDRLTEEADFGPLYSNAFLAEPDVLGWGVPDLDWEVRIETDTSPLSALGFRDGFDFEAAETSLVECGYEPEEVDEGTLFTRDLDSPCGDFDPAVGVPSPSIASIAVLEDDSVMLTASNPEPISAALDTEGASTLQPVLNDLGATTDGLVAGHIAFGERGCADYGSEQELGDPYQSLLVAFADSEEGISGRIALDHASDDDAQAALDARREIFEDGLSLRMRAPYSDILKLNKAERQGDSIVFDVAGAGDGPLPLFQLVYSRDLLFAGC